MKTEIEVIDNVLVVDTIDGNFKAVIDIPTGELIHLEYGEATIQTIVQFVTKAKARYSKVATKAALEGEI